MSIKSLIVATIFAFTSLSSHAQLWIVTASGTIAEGHDYTGVFGTPGQDLTGLHYTNTYTIGINPDKWSANTYRSLERIPGLTSAAHELSGNGPWFTERITINDKNYSFDGPSTNGSLFLMHTVAPPYWNYDLGHPEDEVAIWTQGNFSRDSAVSLYFDYNNDERFVPSLEFTQAEISLSAPESAGTAGVFAFDTYGAQRASFTAWNERMQFTVNPVPEPETGAMLLAGLALIGATARRRQRHSAG